MAKKQLTILQEQIRDLLVEYAGAIGDTYEDMSDLISDVQRDLARLELQEELTPTEVVSTDDCVGPPRCTFNGSVEHVPACPRSLALFFEDGGRVDLTGPSDRNKRGELMSTAETLYERAWRARNEAVEQLKPHILERLGKASGNRMTLKSLVRGAHRAAVAVEAIDAAIVAAKLACFDVTLADIVHGCIVALMNDKIVGYAYRNVNEKPSERTYKLVNSLISHKE